MSDILYDLSVQTIITATENLPRHSEASILELKDKRTFDHFIDIETDPNRAFTNPSITVTSDGLFLLNYWSSPSTSNNNFGGLIDLKLATFRINL